ncbi:hypothetical protein CEUSTIGMA_g5170.t1 [Chlamydomonas eustigma]|uniref:Anaphase-promoting complex subunit 4 WD40 domain-containing protein n=1 Tax=Chlamydomonas eustigma TaxID=1157962 RepID=A0A250X3S6_9CHLO|nr:hypothetical protein CEUSTIGMA_g5170.t1 [Chlamydomonas eustigma]|eukprot:GAX77727.1 hypothetical protein CEUSTIGMA_g5170.t1 [Chlamydomonas eustigma]
MSKGKTFKYGMPIYGLHWPEGNTIYLCGGGGMGIKNRLVCASVQDGHLTDQTAEYLFGENCPMRLNMLPSNKSIVFAMGQGGIKRLDIDAQGRVPKFTEITGDLQMRISDIKAEVKCMSVREDGGYLCLGFITGELIVYEWPSFKVKLDLSGDKKLADGVRDVDFGCLNGSSVTGSVSSAEPRKGCGHIVAVTLDNGTCELWDWEKNSFLCRIEPGKLKQNLEKSIIISSESKTVIQKLPSGIERIQISKLRFARDGSGDLFTIFNTAQLGGHVARWGGIHALSSANTSTAAPSTSHQSSLPSLLACKKVSEHPCTCFEVSRTGNLLAFGTSEGGVVVTLAVRSYALVRKLLKAHMVFTTGITFSSDSKYVLSVSADASARVTEISNMSLNAAAKRDGAKIPGWARHLQGAMLLILLLLVVGLQVVRVLKQRGMSNGEIEAMVRRLVGLNAKDEL